MLGDYKFYLNLEKRKIKDELLNNMKITYRPHYGFIIFSEHDSLRCHPDLNIAQSAFNELKQSGDNVYERIVEFPLWEEYGESIKSDIADLKNVGGREAGAITAGKFLENFVDYPWIHLDIAGPSYLNKADNYRTKGGTGVGVRLLIDFLNHLV